MKTLQAAILLSGSILLFSPPAKLQASIAPAGVDGVQAFFGSQGTGYQDDDPLYGPWTPASTPGPSGYPVAAPLPGVPTPPPPTPITYPGSFGQPFQTTGAVSNFTDFPFTPTSFGTTKIVDVVNPAGTNVWDAAITGVLRLAQSAARPATRTSS